MHTSFFFFFNDTATTEIYPLSLHDALPISHNDDQRVQNQFESLREGKRKHQQRRGKAADHAKQKLDPHEAIREAAVYVAGERAADAHGEQVRADDGGKLKDAVSNQIACKRAGDKLVDEAASRD